MDSKFFTVGCAFLVLLAFTTISNGAPRPTNTELLEKSIAEFLRHEPQLIHDLQQIGTLDSSNFKNFGRVKRQTELQDNGEQDIMGTDDIEDKQPGFFDRAAKFVVEMLQRFLRWINTDNR